MSTEQPRSRNRKKKVVAVVAGVAVLGTAGVAYAYWTADGTGSGSAATGTSVGFTIVQDTVVTNLRPGGPVVPVIGHFTNTAANSANTSVTSVIPAVDSITKAGAPVSGCTAADFTVTTATFTTPIRVNAGATSVPWTGASIQMNERNVNQDACKDVTVNLTYTSTTSTS